MDSADSKSGTDSVAITVNSLPPAISAPKSASINENGSLPFASANGNGISVTDANPGTDSLSLSVSHGTINLATSSGLSFTSGSSGSSSLTVSGTISGLNAALNGVTYQPTMGYTGSDSLAILLSDPGDGGSASTAVSLSIVGLAAPTITAPSTASTTQNVAIVFSSADANGIAVADAGAGAVPDSLTLSVGHGTLTLSTTSGLTFTSGSNGSASFTVTGTLANMNSALNGLTYQPASGSSGPDSLAISISNPDDHESASTSISLTVNPFSPPSITAPTGAVVNENNTLVFSSTNDTAIALTDAGPGSNSDTLTLSVSHGTVTLSTTSGLTFTSGSNGAASLTVTGSVANLNAAVSGLTYKPASGYTGSDQLAISITDTVDNLAASADVALTVSGSSVPAITAPGTVETKTDTVVFTNPGSNAISIFDPSASSNLEELLIRASSGTLKLSTTSGITFVSGSNNSSQMIIEGTLASLNAALNGLSYTLA
ncbi:MAG TPA: hypothetical protein VEI07_07160, partial [Planctomycetaceae bacterium]|nr:hypothetical protein [Planctomycetaceae bacterium]